MTHYCPECMDDKNIIDIEDYVCDKCNDNYCYHFIKTKNIKIDNTMFHDDDLFGNGHICWVCGSEYKPKI